jgi:hypothetical protein
MPMPMTWTGSIRHGVVAVVAAVAIAVCGLAVVSPAAGAVDLLVCKGPTTTTFTPALTNTPTPVNLSFTADYKLCLDATNPLGFRKGVASGSTPAPLVRSCTSLLDPNHLTREITWSTGRRSTWEYDSTSQYVNGELVTTMIGSIVDGEFRYSLATGVTAFATLSLDACAGDGLSHLDGITTLAIVL